MGAKVIEAEEALRVGIATRLFGREELERETLAFAEQLCNLSQVTIFALGIMPYISASIILQLLTVVWPYLERLSKEGELGRKKITQYTRYLTVVLSLIQSIGIASFLQSMPAEGGAQVVLNPGFGFVFMTMLTQTTGTAFIMWLGERITERGIGNGMSQAGQC